uniref:Uncharacterized protein n=1 Tax=Triticum urartu TaxID=4572 RepID=A0A8R7R569_TRIUA
MISVAGPLPPRLAYSPASNLTVEGNLSSPTTDGLRVSSSRST